MCVNWVLAVFVSNFSYLVLLLTSIWIWVLSDFHVLISQTLYCAAGLVFLLIYVLLST